MKLVFKQDGKFMFTTHDLASGNYLLHVTSEDDYVNLTRKFLKR